MVQGEKNDATFLSLNRISIMHVLIKCLLLVCLLLPRCKYLPIHVCEYIPYVQYHVRQTN